MNEIANFLTNTSAYLVVFGSILVATAVIGAIRTRWFQLNLNIPKRLSMAAFGGVLLSLGVVPIFSAKTAPIVGDPVPISSAETAPTTSDPVWFKITDAKIPYQRIRIIVDVNGQRFSYPTEYVWESTSTTSGISQERFLLPAAEKYRVHLRVLADNGNT